MHLAVLVPEGFPVAAGLGVDERPEGPRRYRRIGSVGDGRVPGVPGGQLKKKAAAGVALVELARRVEKAGPEIIGDRPSGRFLKLRGEGAEGEAVGFRGREEGLDDDVVRPDRLDGKFGRIPLLLLGTAGESSRLPVSAQGRLGPFFEAATFG